MAYQITTGNQFANDLRRRQEQSQYQGIRKPSNTIHHAQVASESARFNASVEHDFSQQNPYMNQPSHLYDGQAPPALYQEHIRYAMEQSDQRKASFDAVSLSSANDDDDNGRSYEQELEEAQQLMVQARLDEEIVRQIPPERKNTVEEAEIRNYIPPPIKSHIAYQTTLSSGLPSSPKPNPNFRPIPMAERKPSSIPQEQSKSVDQPKESSSTSSFFSNAARKVSLAFQNRSQSVDETASAPQSQTSPPAPPRAASVSTGPRTIKVACGTATLTVSIAPTTTAMEVLTVCGSELGPTFDARRYVLLESFEEVGSERPIRYYERILDVVHSWDSETDSQNRFHVQTIQALQVSHWEHEELDLYAAPRIVPSDMNTTLYYSHCPESWHKWHFTLASNGTITMQKYPGAESKTVCSLSDCDIYVPSAKQLKKLGAPRKFCFAVKSQQKAALFECSSQYVHFFCTKEKETAQEWFRAIHGWRSHYMVHKLGLETDKGVATTPIRPSFSSASQRNPSVTRDAYRKASETSIYSTRYNNPYMHARAGSQDSNYRYGSTSSTSTSGSRNRSFDSSATEQSLAYEDLITPRADTYTRKASTENASYNQQESQHQQQIQTQRGTRTEFGPFMHALPRNPSVSSSLPSSSSPPPPPFFSTTPVPQPPAAAVVQATPFRKPSTTNTQTPNSPSPFEWRFDPFTGKALPSAPTSTSSLSNPYTQRSYSRSGSTSSSSSASNSPSTSRSGSRSTSHSRKPSRDYSGSTGTRKGSSTSLALRKGSAVSLMAGRKGSRDERGSGNGRKGSVVTLNAAEHLVAW